MSDYGWYYIPVDSTRVQAYTTHERARRLSGEPCDPPADLPERIAFVDGLLDQDGELERGYSLLDEIPVGRRA